jgi:hypothetical protein
MNLDKIRPRLIPSLLSGLETVANNLWLIVLPILLDLAFWLAPHLKVQNILQPYISDYMKELTQFPGQQMAPIPAVQDMLQTSIQHLNLAVAVKTLPIGVPSLIANMFPLFPLKTPYGAAPSIELANAGEVFTWCLIFILVGLILSSIYFGEISRITGKKKDDNLTLGLLGWLTLQLLALTAVILLVALFFGLPALALISGIMYMSPNIGFLAFFIGGLFLIWLVVPLIFSAHGIFTNHLPLFRSIATSIQVVRLNYSGTGLFLLTCVVISQGMNMLWTVPQENSWLLLVGILGHAFINTSLIAASFSFYRDGLTLLQTIIAKTQMVQSSSPEA